MYLRARQVYGYHYAVTGPGEWRLEMRIVTLVSTLFTFHKQVTFKYTKQFHFSHSVQSTKAKTKSGGVKESSSTSSSTKAP